MESAQRLKHAGGVSVAVAVWELHLLSSPARTFELDQVCF